MFRKVTSFILISVFIFTMSGCTSGDSVGVIEFSLTEEENGDLGKLQNSFKTSDEVIIIGVPLTGKTGKYRFILEKDGLIKDTLDFEVSPDWKGIVRKWYLSNEEGEYILKVFSIKDEILISTGVFTLTK